MFEVCEGEKQSGGIYKAGRDGFAFRVNYILLPIYIETFHFGFMCVCDVCHAWSESLEI